MKPLLIFFVLLVFGLMFLIGEHPEYNPLNSDTKKDVPAKDVMSNQNHEADKHIGEE